ncbi:MAG: complex I NDUFA9 subunit family protein [Methylophilaceae bacterium]|nr:complex I NDUFA9 subunit family protein [Methylophilaceae bacterium]
MKNLTVTLLGGSGFVGSHLAHQLDAAGYRVRVLTRRRESAKHLILLPHVEVVECDIGDDDQLRTGVAGADAVVNLVGILHERAGATFDVVHGELPRRIVAACRRAAVSRLLHVSALRAGPNAPSAYLRSKGVGEAVVRQSGLHWTVFRPSVIFGAGDRFLTLFANLARRLPVMFLACPDARFQPVWVEDVARAITISLEQPATVGQSYDMCGPKVYTLRELVTYAAHCVGAGPVIVGLNPACSMLLGTVMEWLPIKLLTRDNVLSMQIDSVCDCAIPSIFGFEPTHLEAVAPAYLSGETPRAHYLRFRTYAGR